MSETSEHAARLLRAYQAQEKRFVERRFPLQFAPEVPVLRELYSQAKAFHWNPETDIAWERFDPSRYRQAHAGGCAADVEPPRLERLPRPDREHRAADPVLPRVRLARHGRQALPVLPSGRGGQAPRGLPHAGRAARRLRARSGRGRPGPRQQSSVHAGGPRPRYSGRGLHCGAGRAGRSARPEPQSEPPAARAKDELVRTAIRLIAGDRGAPRGLRLGVPRQSHSRAGRPRAAPR